MISKIKLGGSEFRFIMKDNFRDKIADTDNFWDIEGMLPEKKPSHRFSHDTSTVEIKLSGEDDTERGQIIPLDNRHPGGTFTTSEKQQEIALAAARKALRDAEIKIKTVSAAASQDKKSAYEEWKRTVEQEEKSDRLFSREEYEKSPLYTDEPLFEYSSEHNPLIKKITIKKWPARYTFYERFRADALKYYQKNPVRCSHVPFFSYTPQYSQLSAGQLEYYLYWRSLVRNGNYPAADYAYILLYIYEIINLPDVISPTEGARQLCLVWREYRKKYPKLDKIIPEWLCDYCLIGKIDPPSELYRDFIDPAAGSLFLREYYAGYDSSSPSPYASALFACGSDYNYRSSKFITPENRELFDKHIRGAFIYAFGKAEKENRTIFAPVGRSSMMSVSITRDAFSGAVCAYNVKRRIELEYLSCSRSVELRFAVTDMIKYAENNVRSMLGIRSRFHTPNLAMPLRRAADEYFASFKKNMKKADAEPRPEYEKLYEASKSELSLDYAKSLEEKSWETTSLLVSDSVDCDEANTRQELSTESRMKPANKISNHVFPPEKPPQPSGASENEFIKTALEALMNHNMNRFSEIAKGRNLLPDTLCEIVNDTLYDEFGDTVVYSEGNRFEIISDYTEDIKEWMKK